MEPFKVLIVGNGSVGKSSIIHRFCTDQYNTNYKKTIGVEYLEKDIEVSAPNGTLETVRLMLYDCAGQEDFDKITQGYYQSKLLAATQVISIRCSSSDTGLLYY